MLVIKAIARTRAKGKTMEKVESRSTDAQTKEGGGEKLFGIKFTKRDLVHLNLCTIAGAMMILSVLVRMEAIWKPSVVGASAIIVALAVIEAGTPNRKERSKVIVHR
jgi:hypothetical protein